MYCVRDVTCSAAAQGLKTVVGAARPCSGCLTGPQRRCVSSQVGGWRCGHAGGTGHHLPGHFQWKREENLEGSAQEILHPAEQNKYRSAPIAWKNVTKCSGEQRVPKSLVFKPRWHNPQPQQTPPTYTIHTTGLHSPCHRNLTKRLILVQTMHSQLSDTPLLHASKTSSTSTSIVF